MPVASPVDLHGKEVEILIHLTTNDDYIRHRNSVASYQLHGTIRFEDRFCASRKGGTRGGEWVSPGG